MSDTTNTTVLAAFKSKTAKILYIVGGVLALLLWGLKELPKAFDGDPNTTPNIESGVAAGKDVYTGITTPVEASTTTTTATPPTE